MMDSVNLNDKQRLLIEKLGVNSEKEGLAPAAARVAALLLVSPDLALTFDQIRNTLNLSKSATSNALNMLLSTERIEYITQPGDRKRYFKSKLGTWRDGAKNSFHKITKTADLLEEVLNCRPQDTEDFNRNLREAISFMRFIEKRLPALYQEWEDKHE